MALGGSDSDLEASTKAIYACLSVFLICVSGIMAGLTLGYLSLDQLDLQVIQRTGSPKESRRASRVLPVIRHSHWVLTTLVMCNALCYEALPIFLDRLLDPISAILLSTTAILIFGELLPQALCSRHSVAIGSFFAPFTRVLMWITSPLSWPLSWVLDRALGHEDPLMKRRELKAMVDLHAETGGLGGHLTVDEVNVISGALEMTSKTAAKAMTPVDKVVMISDEERLDEGLVKRLLQTGHSRFPVYRGDDKDDIMGLLLIKELLHYFRVSEQPRVGDLRLRPVPRIPVDTPMFDVLNLFQTGRSHLAILMSVPKRRRHRRQRPSDDSSHTSSSIRSSSAPLAARSVDASDAGGSHIAVGVLEVELQNRSGARTMSGRSMSERSSADSDGEPGWLSRQLKRISFIGGPSSEDGSSPRDVEQGHEGSEQVGEEEDDGPFVSRPVGIITLEDVIEELMQEEIVDETDRFLDNEQSKRVDVKALVGQLPPRVRGLLQAHLWEAATLLARHSHQEQQVREAAVALAPLPARAAAGPKGCKQPLMRRSVSANEIKLARMATPSPPRRSGTHQGDALHSSPPPAAGLAAGGVSAPAGGLERQGSLGKSASLPNRLSQEGGSDGGR